MVEEMIRRMKSVEEESEDYGRGVTLFYRFVFSFLLIQGGEPDDLLALDRLAKARQETEESLSKLPDHSGLSQGFGEELDFFFRWAKGFQRD